MSNDNPNLQAGFEQQPPIVKNFYVQKLMPPLSSGENLKFTVEFYKESNIPNKLNIFKNQEISLVLKDDGIAPDAFANDFKYTAYMQQDIEAFKQDILKRQTKILADGGVVHFSGHDGSFNPASKMQPFDVPNFDDGFETKIYLPILDVTFCDNDLGSEKSLFITDLSVVEDPSRTFNVFANTGNPQGAWTFGQLMNNIANTQKSGVATKEFLKQWVKTWMINQSIGIKAKLQNPQHIDLKARPDIITHLIQPWIKKAHPTPFNLPSFFDLTDPKLHATAEWRQDWEIYWNECSETDLLKFAPFKLTAIVNRLDLRGNFNFNPIMGNAGETRFIFSLINPENGHIPFHHDISGNYANLNGSIDWGGMNVILEYGNPLGTQCAIYQFGQMWYDLSSFNLNTTAFNDHLQNITDIVTKRRTWGKHSNINQIRTNEKIFDELFTTLGGAPNTSAWIPPDWELRQYEQGNDGYLKNVVVTNTPIDEDPFLNPIAISHNTNAQLNLNSYTNNGLLPWIYSANNGNNKLRVINGNHNLPQNLLGGSAVIYREMTHFFNFDISNSTEYPLQVYNPTTFNPALDLPSLEAKTIRHQLSLNSCQGCHGGDTKTNFTMVYPRGYGEEANYWDVSAPTIVQPADILNSISPFSTQMDNSFNTQNNNSGQSFWRTSASTFGIAPNSLLPEKTDNESNQIVSPFITGRRITKINGVVSWEDDEIDNTLSQETGLLNDMGFQGLFNVYDPSNNANTLKSLIAPFNYYFAGNEEKGGEFPQLHNKKWGYNELLNRKKDLCKLIQGNCMKAKFELTELMGGLATIPFPIGAH